MGNLQIFLKAGERIFINGAVIKVDRKVSLEFLNDVNFLLENHVMQKEDATTPFKQLYYVIQLLFLHPDETDQTKVMIGGMIKNLMEVLETEELKAGIRQVQLDCSTGKAFEALKTLRELFSIEQGVYAANEQPLLKEA